MQSLLKRFAGRYALTLLLVVLESAGWVFSGAWSTAAPTV